jgi:ADP-ribosylglycohydrolase
VTGKSTRHDAEQPSLLDTDEPRPDAPVQSDTQSRATPARVATTAAGNDSTASSSHRVDSYVLEASVGSALWAAWADAVGFISELTSIDGMLRRLGSERHVAEGSAPKQLDRLLDDPPNHWPLRSTVEWRRRVGGRGGPTITLPAGTYSDDTQLRLATSRCIDAGRFNPEVFAHIELPAFTSYGLGGGRATKAGAAAMTKGAAWAAPGHESWAGAGGNGVVMRVAPHGWAAAAHEVSPRDLALDVIRNGVSTHGHPRALLPACLHALTLARTLGVHDLPPLHELHRWIEDLSTLPDEMADDPVLGSMTLRAFDTQSRDTFGFAWHKTSHEMHELTDRFASIAERGSLIHGYVDAARDVGLFAKATMGAGTSSFIAGYWIAQAFQDDPITGVLLAANAVGTDTDTIATIAGVHLGAVRPFSLNQPLLDREYIEAETLRLVAPTHPSAAAPMQYPDLAGWQAPRAQADYVGIDPSSGREAIAGLGAGEWISRPVGGNANPDFLWQWFAADFGQSLPVKRRANLAVLPVEALPEVVSHGRPGGPTVEESEELTGLRARAARANEAARVARKRPPGRLSSAERDRAERADAERNQRAQPVSEVHATMPASAARPLERALAIAEASNFSDEVVGRLARALALEASADEALAFFGAALAHWRLRRR